MILYFIGALLVALVVLFYITWYVEAPIGTDCRIIERPHVKADIFRETAEQLPFLVETMRRGGYRGAKQFMTLKQAQEFASMYSLGDINLRTLDKRVVVAEIKNGQVVE